MKNIINFDLNLNPEFSSLTNINDLRNDIRLEYDGNAFTAPKVEFTKDGASVFFDGVVKNGRAVVYVPYTLFDGAVSYMFRFVDGSTVGQWFNMISIEKARPTVGRTMKVARLDGTSFRVVWVTTNENENKNVEEIGVQTGDDGSIEMIVFTYDDDSTSEHAVEYDADGNLTTFGSLPINWGVKNGE